MFIKWRIDNKFNMKIVLLELRLVLSIILKKIVKKLYPYQIAALISTKIGGKSGPQAFKLHESWS